DSGNEYSDLAVQMRQSAIESRHDAAMHSRLTGRKVSALLAMVDLRARESRVSEQTSTPKLTDQFAKAVVYAERKHHKQVRKGGDIPYVGHLLSVASLVINDNGTEAQAIAALLHDAVEDQGGAETLQEIK